MLIPRFSYIGAAAATVISQFIHVGLLYYFTRKEGYSLDIIRIIYRPIIAGILMVILIIYIKPLAIIYIIPFSAIFYFLALSLIGGLGKEEKRLIKSIFHRKTNN